MTFWRPCPTRANNPMAVIPYGRHQIDEDDIVAVAEVLRGGALTAGPKAEEFEKAFAKKIGAKEAVVCSNGTAALHLAAMAEGIGPGDVAIVPTLTFLSTANAVRMTGAEVLFADVDAETGLLTPETLKAAYGKAKGPVKAVLPVHLNGQCTNVAEIQLIATSNGSAIISDCCHALGAEYHTGGRPGDGQFEDSACFSLHPVKSIAMGEGGMITTNDTTKAAHMRLLRSHDMKRDPSTWLAGESNFDLNGKPNPWVYEMHELAYNYRAPDILCALGLSQLHKLDKFVARRREIAALYDGALASLGNVLKPVIRTAAAESAWHLYPVLIDFKSLAKDRAQLMRELLDKGVGTQVHYIPVSSQPYYEKRYGSQSFTGADKYYERVLSLPIFPGMSDDNVFEVVSALKSVLG